MECRVRIVKGNYHAAFKVHGVEYTHSLRTKSAKEAEVRLGAIRDTLYRIENGTLAIPDGGDPKAFVLSGGRNPQRPEAGRRLTLGELADRYSGEVRGIEPNTRATLAIHLGHLRRHLGGDTPMGNLNLPRINGYATARSGEAHRGRPISSRTIRKELQTLRSAWAWGLEQGVMGVPPDWSLKSVRLPKDRGREPFRSREQIERIIRRGGVGEVEQARLWETLYLNGTEIGELLDFAGKAARLPWVFPMIATAALTGCRRSEMVRSQIDDWDLDGGILHVREKKRDASKDFTLRQVNIHPTLGTVFRRWLEVHPGGRNAFTATGRPLTVQKATEQFRRTMDASPHWAVVRGFHTLRHSVASILASRGVDQRYIDKLMGHQNEEMRLRYQHLFPRGVADAIHSLIEPPAPSIPDRQRHDSGR